MFALKSLFTAIVISLLTLSTGINSYAQTKIRVGTYDSRLIAMAYYNSKYFKLLPEVKERMKIAKEKNDTAEVSSINKEMTLRQRYMHEQGFGKGSVCYLIEEIKEKVSELAKNEKLDIVVSKWELNFNNTNVELIDISEKLANLFEPSKDMSQMMNDLNNIEPSKDAFLFDD